ncbi:hypothetical protein KSP40_PGU018222 [Platanthera guangdongensis]|uniref:Uncharacterized protein n=1 Tax=Platanthera guangdongensis TaxID=2320717 RepID=A0ABR2MU05_9ASPA
MWWSPSARPTAGEEVAVCHGGDVKPAGPGSPASIFRRPRFIRLCRPRIFCKPRFIPNDARSNAWVSFDGKRRQQLSRGDAVRICMSPHPLPTVNKCDQTGDWFHSLVRCLNWNDRLDQKAL